MLLYGISVHGAPTRAFTLQDATYSFKGMTRTIYGRRYF
jgi:hypothetical protein